MALDRGGTGVPDPDPIDDGGPSDGDDSVGGGTGLGDDTQDTGARGSGGDVDAGSGYDSDGDRRSTSSGGSSEPDTRTVSGSTTVGLTDSAAGAIGGAGDYGDFDSPAAGGVGGQGTPTVDDGDLGVSVGVGSGPTPDEADSALNRDTLRDLGTGFSQNVAAPIGAAARFASPATELDRVAPGEPVGRTVENVNQGAIDAVNPAAIADSAIGLGASGVEDTRNVVEQGPIEGSRENLGDARTAVERGAAGFVGGVQADPVGTLSRTAGGFAGGAVAGTAVARTARRASRTGGADSAGGGAGSAAGSSRFDGLSSAVDFEDFRNDARGQLGGRQRRGSDTPEQTTVERTLTRDEDTDTVDPEEFVDQRTRNVDDEIDLESEIEQMAREQDRLSGRQQTPRQRAEQRAPPEEAFDSPMARQREVSRLEDRFRQQDMSDLENRVVPNTGGVDATTAGRFGLDDLGATGAGGGAATAQEFGQPPAGGVESEPVVEETGSTFAPGVDATSETADASGTVSHDGVTPGLVDATQDTGARGGEGGVGGVEDVETGGETEPGDTVATEPTSGGTGAPAVETTTVGTGTQAVPGTGVGDGAVTGVGLGLGGDVEKAPMTETAVGQRSQVGNMTGAGVSSASTATVSDAMTASKTTTQPATPVVPRASNPPKRVRRPEDPDETGPKGDEMDTPPGVVGADFLNPTESLSDVDDTLSDDLGVLDGP